MDNDNKQNTGKTQADNAGENVAGIDQVLKYEYNLKGEQTSMQRDNNVDDKYDYREVYTLDANGRQTAKDIDLTNDGKFDSKEVYTREADGGLEKTEFYNVIQKGENTQEILTKVEHYELNSSNQRTGLWRNIDGRDTGSADLVNGKPVSGIEYVEKYKLDAQGNIIQIQYNLDGKGDFEKIEYRVLNADGKVYKSYINSDLADSGMSVSIEGFGEVKGIDEITTNFYNPNGYVVRSETDVTANGLGTDKFITYTRDNYGRAATTEYDNDGLALTPVDKVEYRFFDEKDRTIRMEEDIRSNGVGIDAVHYNEEFDDYNRVTKWWYDSDNDGVRGNKRDETRENIQYDENDRVIFENARWDWGATPSVKYGYDEYGRMIRFDVDYNRNGQIDGSDAVIIRKTFSEQFMYNELTTLTQKGNGNYDMRYGYFNDKGEFRFELADWDYDITGKSHSIDRMFWGQRTDNARDESFNFMTDFAKEELSRFNNALDEIGLSGEYYSTKITLDKETVSKIADTHNGLRIYGDSKDIVYLKDKDADFKQEGTIIKEGIESTIYTTEVDGSVYTLYIDNEVSVLSV